MFNSAYRLGVTQLVSRTLENANSPLRYLQICESLNRYNCYYCSLHAYSSSQGSTQQKDSSPPQTSQQATTTTGRTSLEKDEANSSPFQSTNKTLNTVNHNYSKVQQDLAGRFKNISNYGQQLFQGRSAHQDDMQPPKGTRAQVLVQQAEAFVQRNQTSVSAIAILTSGYFIWSATWPLRALPAAMGAPAAWLPYIDGGILVMCGGVVAAVAAGIKARHTVNPWVAYKLAMNLVAASPRVQVAISNPIRGTYTWATLSSGGGIRVKGWSLHVRSRHLYMVFPIYGSFRGAFVALHASKQQGVERLMNLYVYVPDSPQQTQKGGGGSDSASGTAVAREMSDDKEVSGGGWSSDPGVGGKEDVKGGGGG